MPATSDGLMKFLKDERARELFQEGLRLYDLRRWDENADVYAAKALLYQFTYTNLQNLPIWYSPFQSAEINAGFGVEQNDWSSTLRGNRWNL